MFVGLISLPCSSFTILERHEALVSVNTRTQLQRHEGRLRAAATLRDEQRHWPAEGKSLQVCALLLVPGLLWSRVSCGLGSGGMRAVYELLRC